ncbi:MAG: hypothetical protein ACTSW1_15370 [Candidatus Hodarchaeales archaeon]
MSTLPITASASPDKGMVLIILAEEDKLFDSKGNITSRSSFLVGVQEKKVHNNTKRMGLQ